MPYFINWIQDYFLFLIRFNNLQTYKFALWVYLCFENEDRSLWIGSVWSGLIATCTQESLQEEREIFMHDKYIFTYTCSIFEINLWYIQLKYICDRSKSLIRADWRIYSSICVLTQKYWFLLSTSTDFFCHNCPQLEGGSKTDQAF